jgi:hypothetical protein
MISFLVGMFFLDQVSWSSTNSVGCMYGTELKALELIYWVLCSFLDITTQPNISNFQPHQNEDHQQNSGYHQKLDHPHQCFFSKDFVM